MRLILALLCVVMLTGAEFLPFPKRGESLPIPKRVELLPIPKIGPGCCSANCVCGCNQTGQCTCQSSTTTVQPAVVYRIGSLGQDWTPPVPPMYQPGTITVQPAPVMSYRLGSLGQNWTPPIPQAYQSPQYYQQPIQTTNCAPGRR